MRAARLARQIWRDPDYADSLEKQAGDLKRRFNRDFWLGDDEYFAVALDADGRKDEAALSSPAF
jgi:glycogen debranching enzyme